jgi:uncharacterized membrane protein
MTLAALSTFVKKRVPQKIERKHIVYGLLISVLLLASTLSLLNLSPYRAEPVRLTQYYRARVLQVRTVQTDSGVVQNMQVKLLDGSQKGKAIAVTRSLDFGDAAYKRMPVGSEILLSKNRSNGNVYSFSSRWFMPGIATLFLVLLVLVIAIGAWRGITSIFGLAISICILAVWVVPQIVNGHSAFTACIEGAILITLVSVFVAHGISKRTTVAFVGSLVALLVVIGLTGLASYLVGSSEIINEGNIGVLYATHPIDVAGLLTGGVVIASLGTLFDITTGQAAIIDELHAANRKQSTKQLFIRGMSVGREHIAALINTLALVYAGVALPTIVTTVLLAQNNIYAHNPLIVTLNTETVAEEVIRTCVASIGMLLALPITTWLAAYVLPRWKPTINHQTKTWLQRLKVQITSS